MDGNELDRCISTVARHVSNLVGLEVDPKGHLLSVAATDGHVLTRLRVAPGTGSLYPLPVSPAHDFLQACPPQEPVVLTIIHQGSGAVATCPPLILQAGARRQEFSWSPDHPRGPMPTWWWEQKPSSLTTLATAAAPLFLAVLRRVAPAANHDKRIPPHEAATAGIYARLRLQNPGCTLVACEGRLLALGTLPLTTLTQESEVLLPVAAAEHFARFLARQPAATAEILLSTSDQTAVLRCGALEVWTRLLALPPTSHPLYLGNYQRLLPTAPPAVRVQVGARPLLAALQALNQQAHHLPKPPQRVLYCQQQATELHLALSGLDQKAPRPDAPVVTVPVQSAIGQLPTVPFLSHLFTAAVRAAALTPVISLETTAAAETKPMSTPWAFRSGSNLPDLGLLHPLVR